MLLGMMIGYTYFAAFAKLTSEDLSRYWNKIELVGLRKT